MNENQKYETIGRAIAKLSYWWYAFKLILVFSLIALVVLYLVHKPLWFAPIIGVVVFLIYRTIRRAFYRILFRAARKASK